MLWGPRRTLLMTEVVSPVKWWDPAEEGLCVWGAWSGEGAASFAASLADLTVNGHNLGDPGGTSTPGWDTVGGWDMDGINDYLTTTFVPDNDESQTMFIKFSDVANDGALAGMLDASNAFEIEPDINGDGSMAHAAHGIWGGGGNFKPSGILSGTVAISGFFFYRNGVADAGFLPTWFGGPTLVPVYLGMVNGGARRINAKIQRFALYDCALNGTQIAAIHTAAMA